MSEVISDAPRESAACPESNEDQTGMPPNTWRGHLRHFATIDVEHLIEMVQRDGYASISTGSVELGERASGARDFVILVLAKPHARDLLHGLTCAPKTAIERNLMIIAARTGAEVPEP
jgi:hypothetical protein